VRKERDGLDGELGYGRNASMYGVRGVRLAATTVATESLSLWMLLSEPQTDDALESRNW